MGRAAKFTEEQLLDTALGLVAAGGPAAATVTAVAATLDAPVGSIYHRFRSRDVLLARLWVRTVQSFQQGFLAALADDDLDRAALRAALHSLEWVREHVEQARLLLLHRREDLLAAGWPEDLSAEAASLNSAAERAVRAHASARYGDGDETSFARVRFALVDIPQAAVRRYLAANASPPPIADELVTEACRCILGIAADDTTTSDGASGNETGA